MEHGAGARSARLPTPVVQAERVEIGSGSPSTGAHTTTERPGGATLGQLGEALGAIAWVEGVRIEEPGLVCEYDCLDAVTKVELLEDVRDVCLDGGVADVELLPELRVGEAVCDQAEDLLFTRG